MDPDCKAELQKWTYGMLQGWEVSFPSGCARPFKRCVIFMGQLMVDWARERNVLSPNADIDHMHADSMTDAAGKETVMAWLATSVNVAAVRRELEGVSDAEMEDDE